MQINSRNNITRESLNQNIYKQINYQNNNQNDNQNMNQNTNDQMDEDEEFVIGAWIRGGEIAPEISGIVTFQEVPGGTQVSATIIGLPDYQPAQGDQAPIGPFGFHIHEHGDCTSMDPSHSFAQSGGHWNPTNQPHGNHAGDLPVLFSNNGYSQMTFFTDKFQPNDVLGKSVIIHQNPDDYRTEPAGNSGERIACGVIDYILVS